MNDTTGRWPSIVWSNERQRASLTRAVERGKLRRLSPGLYTGAVDTDPVSTVRTHLWEIVGHELPGAVVADRSARTCGPVDGELFVVHPRSRPLELPGVIVRPRTGPGPLLGDTPLPNGLHLASRARTMLESLSRPGGRRLDRTEIEHWIDDLAAHGDEGRLSGSATSPARSLQRCEPPPPPRPCAA